VSFNQAVEAIGRGVGVMAIAGGIGLTTLVAAGRLWRRQSQVYRRFTQPGATQAGPTAARPVGQSADPFEVVTGDPPPYRVWTVMQHGANVGGAHPARGQPR
jgi:hypothetical protein